MAFKFDAILFLHFLVVGSVRQIKLTYVGFRAHVKIASRIVSCRIILQHGILFEQKQREITAWVSGQGQCYQQSRRRWWPICQTRFYLSKQRCCCAVHFVLYTVRSDSGSRAGPAGHNAAAHDCHVLLPQKVINQHQSRISYRLHQVVE